MTLLGLLILLTLFQIKHLWIDFLWQPSYEYLNKGTFLHPGGIRHSFKHALASLLILGFVPHLGPYPWVFWSLIFGEFVIHYLIDFSKVNINKKFGWGPTTHAEYWYLTGFDQFLHQMTYLGMVTVLTFIL